MTFGRKGVAPGGAAQRPQANGSVSSSPFATPARPIQSESVAPASDPITAKREAFIAAERALSGVQASAAVGGALAASPSPAYASSSRSSGQISDVAQSFKGRAKNGFFDQFSPKKPSLIIAYLLWFSFCNIGAHRIYLGEVKGGLYQAALLISSIVLAILVWTPFAFGFVLWLLWVLSDVFVIHKWHKKRVEEAEFDTSIFA